MRRPSMRHVPEGRWSNAAELTMVFTGGNAESSTLGFRNEPGCRDHLMQGGLIMRRVGQTELSVTNMLEAQQALAGTTCAALNVSCSNGSTARASGGHTRGRPLSRPCTTWAGPRRVSAST